MKRCPECRRDYHDDSLSYCLDDGAALVDGPASYEIIGSELPTRQLNQASRKAASTEILKTGADLNSRGRHLWLVIGAVAIIAIGIVSHFALNTLQQPTGLAYASDAVHIDLSWIERSKQQ